MSNVNPQNIIRKKNIELTIRKIFDIKIKSNDFNNIVLNELNGFQNIFYLKNKKIFQFFLRKKKKQELDILKNQEIIYLTTNMNHDSLICLTNNGSIFSVNYETFNIKYFSNLDFTKFIMPNIITSKKRSFSFSQKSSNKNNINNLNYIYNIFCNNFSDKIVLNLNKYILFWYQNNYNIENNNINNYIDSGNKIETVSGTIYSIIKENEIEKITITGEKKFIENKINININSDDKNNNIINEGVEVVFENNYFLGSHTRIFYVVLISLNKEIKLFIFDYLFKFNYKNRFRCLTEIPKDDFSFGDLFNGAENEDLNDIKSKISSTNIEFNSNINSIENKNMHLKKVEDKNKINFNNNLILKANSKGNILAIIINDDKNNTNLLNMNLFLIILTSKGYFFLLNINFQAISIIDISLSLSNFDTYYIPSFLEKSNLITSKKNDTNNLKLSISKQREDLFMISDDNYIICYQINSKMYENKIINMEIPSEQFQNFLFFVKYYQLNIYKAQIDYLTPEELATALIDLMSKHLQNLFKKNENVLPIPNSTDEIIQTETGIKIMKTKQNNEDYMRQESIITDDKKGDLDYFKNRQNNLIKNGMNDNLYINLVKFINIFQSLNLLHEKNLRLIGFILGKSVDFLILLMNNKELWLATIFLELCEKYLCSRK